MIVVLVGFGLALVAGLTTRAASAMQDVAGDHVDRGAALYQATCAACHGTVAQGGRGEGVVAGPALTDIDLAYLDLTMRTGRMPIAEPSVGVRSDHLDDDEREAVVAFMAERFGLTGHIPEVGDGDAARGQEQYIRNCAACHGAAADGGISGATVRVPPLADLDGIAIAEGIRVGPFEMPAFEATVIDDEAIDDIVAYLEVVDATPRTAAGVKELDQIGEALFAVGLALAAAVVLLVVARARRWSPGEPEGYHASPPFEPRDGFDPPTAGGEFDP